MTDSPENTPRNCLSCNKPHNNNEIDCPWYINSPEHSNDFWQYVKAHSSIDGSMPELVQSQIAQLMGWSNTKTHFMLKQAVSELVETLKKHQANQLLSNGPSNLSDFNSFQLDPVSAHGSDEPEE